MKILKEPFSYFQKNYLFIYSMLPILWILKQALILWQFNLLVLFSREYIITDTFYMIIILLLYIISFGFWIFNFIEDSYSWMGLLLKTVFLIIIYLVAIVIRSDLLWATVLLSWVFWIILHLNYLIKPQPSKKSFGIAVMIWCLVSYILYFNLYMFNNIYDARNWNKIQYFNDKYVIYENRIITENQNIIFILSWSNFNLPFIK